MLIHLHWQFVNSPRMTSTKVINAQEPVSLSMASDSLSHQRPPEHGNTVWQAAQFFTCGIMDKHRVIIPGRYVPGHRNAISYTSSLLLAFTLDEMPRCNQWWIIERDDMCHNWLIDILGNEHWISITLCLLPNTSHVWCVLLTGRRHYDEWEVRIYF